jgi:DNA-binding NarL/FixJ family response regulator
MPPVRIVTVDDQAYFRDAARAIATSIAGFEIVGESATGEAAIELVRRLDPDMVIIDVRMAKLDGIETARLLSAEDPTRVLVLVSSADVGGLSLVAESSGAAAIVRKDWLNRSLLRGLWIAHRRR